MISETEFKLQLSAVHASIEAEMVARLEAAHKNAVIEFHRALDRSYEVVAQRVLPELQAIYHNVAEQYRGHLAKTYSIVRAVVGRVLLANWNIGDEAHQGDITAELLIRNHTVLQSVVAAHPREAADNIVRVALEALEVSDPELFAATAHSQRLPTRAPTTLTTRNVGADSSQSNARASSLDKNRLISAHATMMRQ